MVLPQSEAVALQLEGSDESEAELCLPRLRIRGRDAGNCRVLFASVYRGLARGPGQLASADASSLSGKPSCPLPHGTWHVSTGSSSHPPPGPEDCRIWGHLCCTNCQSPSVTSGASVRRNLGQTRAGALII